MRGVKGVLKLGGFTPESVFCFPFFSVSFVSPAYHDESLRVHPQCYWRRTRRRCCHEPSLNIIDWLVISERR